MTDEERKTKAAEHAAAWRGRHPDRYRKTKARQAARRRAFVRLAHLHQREFDAIYAEELLRTN